MIKSLGGKTAQVGGQVGLAADELAELREFVGAELVGIVLVSSGRRGRFFRSPKIRAARAFVARANAVAPIVAVGEAAAREANDRRLDLAHFLDQLFANAVYVGDFGVFADPDAVVNDAAEVFGEVPVNIGGNSAERLVEQNFDARIRGGGRGEEGWREFSSEERRSSSCGAV